MVRRLAHTYQLWSIPGMSAPRVTLAEVRPDAPAPGDSRLLALSGGIDSTAAAIETLARPEYRYALCIAGADYPTMDHPGFQNLLPRVRRIARRTGKELLVVETDQRRLMTRWELTFLLALAGPMAFCGRMVRGAGFGADLLPTEDHVLHPWGASHALASVLSTEQFKITAFNRHLGRTGKLAAIHREAPELLGQLSFCWQDTSTGGNCGTCSKCVRTKLNFIAAELEPPSIFRDPVSPAAWLRQARPPRSMSAARNDYIQLTDIHFNMASDEPLRPLVATYLARLRRRIGLRD